MSFTDLGPRFLEHRPSAYKAAERCSFNLTFHRSTRRRRFQPGYLDGEPIADARHPNGTNCGGWEHIDNAVPETDDPDRWFDHYASMAVAQCVHEALEWFHVDGDLWLDPHDDRVSGEIDELCAGLSRRLADLRRELDTIEKRAGVTSTENVGISPGSWRSGRNGWRRKRGAA